jgi:hypothetical protein
MAALRFRFAPPPASHGAGDNLELTINLDHSEGAGKGDVFDDVECVYNPTRRHSTLATSVLSTSNERLDSANEFISVPTKAAAGQIQSSKIITTT